ncbi:hypothetical protein [Mucilaginibacter sp.]|uniref:hypothetical protein n=1 Tax=Mucilaginibacter sp. TaxID=1882438 RepID=UPI00374DBC83
MRKKNLKFALLLTTSAIVFGFQSCKKINESNDFVESRMSDSQIISTYSKIGEVHNKTMDFVYNGIVGKINSTNRASSPSSNSSSENDTFEISLEDLNKLVVEYVKDSLQATGFADYKVFYNKDTIIKNSGFSNNSLSTHHSLVTNNSLSSELSTALVKLESLFKDDAINEQYVKYDSLISQVVPTLSDDLDKKAFTTATSIAKNSTLYWKENKAKWDSLARNYSMPTSFQSSLAGPGKDIVYADIAGGITGLIRGAVVGATGGTVAVPGVGTVAGAAAGGMVGAAVGGVVGSAAEGLHSLIKWAIGW